MIMDFPYICDHQVGYSADGYSLYPRWFLTWYISPFFQDWLHWWLLILHKTYDQWSVAVLTVTEHFIYSNFWFFSYLLLSAMNSICLPPFVLFFLWSWILPIFLITKWATLLVDIHCPQCGSKLSISIHFLRTGFTYECWYCTKPMITGLFLS